MRTGGRMSIELSGAEARVLFNEIGDIPKLLVGPKLLELYVRLSNMLDLNEEAHTKSRKLKSPVSGNSGSSAPAQ